MAYIERNLIDELPRMDSLPQVREEPEVQEPTGEVEEEPTQKKAEKKKAPKKEVTINDIIMNHENRIRDVEAGIFRISGGL